MRLITSFLTLLLLFFVASPLSADVGLVDAEQPVITVLDVDVGDNTTLENTNNIIQTFFTGTSIKSEHDLIRKQYPVSPVIYSIKPITLTAFDYVAFNDWHFRQVYHE